MGTIRCSFVFLTIFILIFLTKSTMEYINLSVENDHLCSPVTKRKIKLGIGSKSGLIVSQMRLDDHALLWNSDLNCKFEVQSFYRKGGVTAVIQKLNFRRNETTGSCIDYIQFKDKEKRSRQICGIIDANFHMRYPYYDPENCFLDSTGELDVIIHVSKVALKQEEHTNLLIVFTSYIDCSRGMQDFSYSDIKPCSDEYARVCIDKQFFGDTYVNCPYPECVDEFGCSFLLPQEQNISKGNKILIGSISSLLLLFALFILCLWAFRKHKLLCWAENFAHPTPTPESNRNSRIMELNEQTGARLAESHVSGIPTAPTEDKDLPPSYDSLFPDTR